jgi:uncharacterized protein HemY
MARSSASTTTVSEAAAPVGRARLSLDDVRNQAASEVAVRLTRLARMVDGVRLGVLLITAKADDFDFLLRVSEEIRNQNMLHQRDFVRLAQISLFSLNDG